MDTYLGNAKQEITVLLNNRKEVLWGGAAKDFAEYRNMVGSITGLELAIRIIDDLQKRIDISNGDIDD
jgi:hypothetical protein